MKLAPAQLAKHLKGSLAPIYIVSGDEPLLCQEATDSIRAACRKQGFSERRVFHVENGFEWGMFREEASALSLFAEQKLIELRIPAGKPSDAGTQALLEYVQQPPSDTVLLITLPKLDSKTQKLKWAKALIESNHSQFVAIWPLELAQFPDWLRQRLQQTGLNPTPDALSVLASRTEGNLLAAVQEITKLRLLVEGNTLELEAVENAVVDSARFDLFGLLDALLAGQAEHAVRMLHGLRAEGIEAPVILWGITREIRQLAALARQHEQGTPLSQAINHVKPPIFGKRQALVTQAVRRFSSLGWSDLLAQTQHIDAQIKGQTSGDPWINLISVALKMTGRAFSLPLA